MTDFSKKIPVWYQLVMMLRSDILSGDLAAGARIEPEIRLAARHAVSVMPVRQALRSLEAEGLITRKRGLGTFVRDRSRANPGSTSLESLYSNEFDTPAKIIAQGVVSTPKSLRMHFKDIAKLGYVKRIAYRDRKPWSYGTLYYLPQFKARITTKRLERLPLYRIIQEQYGVHLARSKFSATAAGASLAVAAHLEVEPFSPILSLASIAYDQSERAVGAFDMDFIGEPNLFSFETLHSANVLAPALSPPLARLPPRLALG